MRMKITALLMVIAMLISSMVHAETIKIQKFLFSESTVSIPLNYCWQASYKLEPAEANETFVWKSSNEKIATVNQNGLITGLKKGDCNITVYTENGKARKAQLKVKVKEYDAVLSMADARIKVSFETRDGGSSSMIQIGNRVNETSTETVVTFKNGCVKSDESHYLIPVKAGEETVTVTVTNKQNRKKKVDKYTYNVLVTQDPLLSKEEQMALEEASIVPLDIPAQSISFTEQNIILAPETTWALKPVAEPRGALIQNVQWSSSNEKVAKVDKNGVITGVGKGSAKITAALENGAKATINVKVNKYDLVFRDKTPQTVQYSHGSGRFYISGSVENGNVSIPNIDGYTMAIVAGGKSYNNVDVTPEKQGEDVVIIKVNNKQFKYTVYVSQEVFAEPDKKPNGDIKDAKTLEFLSVEATESASYIDADGIYQLTTLRSQDPATEYNALRFILKEPEDFTKYATLSFSVKDLQGSNTHKVTIVDKYGKKSSAWIEIPSKRGEWVTIDAQLADLKSGADLTKVAEFRIGEWNKGIYLFDRICLK